MLAQETGGDHADAVVHQTGGIELTHAGIDQRITGSTLAPALKFVLIITPLDAIIGWFEALVYCLREMPENLAEELPPDQLIAKTIADIECLLYDLTDTDGTEAQMR